jgi:MFS family permease
MGDEMALVEHYRAIFANRPFRLFWLGFTFSALGDAMTQVALIWLVYQSTHSARVVGLFLFAYTAPVLVGGFLVGPLLDRYDRRTVMLIDSLARGFVVALIPLLNAFGHLSLLPVFAAAAIYGLLKMITLAGGPALVPSIVPDRQLATANALETLGYTVSGVVGPPLAGLLIPVIGAPNVVIVDALSYLAFALALAGIRPADTGSPVPARQGTYSLRDAIAILQRDAVLRTTTLMFMVFNLGEGALFVWLPLYVTTLGGGSALYGVLLGALAVGETISALLAGGINVSISLGTLICIAQTLSGLSLCVLLLGRDQQWAVVSLALLGACSAPLTIWAQTLRMRVIPAALRGRTFALLRTLMQGTVPIAGALAGLALPVVGLAAMIACSAALIGVPGPLGYGVAALRSAGGTHAPAQPEPAIEYHAG